MLYRQAWPSASSYLSKVDKPSKLGFSGFLPLGFFHWVSSGRVRSCDEWMFGVNFPQAGYRIDRSFLVSEFRFRTKIALPITTLELNLLMNQ
jgi:hypothetical protein